MRILRVLKLFTIFCPSFLYAATVFTRLNQTKALSFEGKQLQDAFYEISTSTSNLFSGFLNVGESLFERNGQNLESYTKRLRSIKEYIARDKLFSMSLIASTVDKEIQICPYLIQYSYHSIYGAAFCPYSTLSQVSKLKQMGSLEIQKLAEHISKAIEFMHRDGIAHMDIRPENIFFEQSQRSAYGTLDSPAKYVLGGLGFAFAWEEDWGEGKLIQNPVTEFASPLFLSIKKEIDEDRIDMMKQKYFFICRSNDYFALGLTLAALRIGYESVKPKWDTFRNEIINREYPDIFDPILTNLLNILLHMNNREILKELKNLFPDEEIQNQTANESQKAECLLM